MLRNTEHDASDRLTCNLKAGWPELGYEKTIRTAFGGVSDALIGYRKAVEQRQQQELLVNALREAQRLSTLRYRGGLESYLQVLDAERNLLQATSRWRAFANASWTRSCNSIVRLEVAGAEWAALDVRAQERRQTDKDNRRCTQWLR
jgi:outer membrane protein TolC